MINNKKNQNEQIYQTAVGLESNHGSQIKLNESEAINLFNEAVELKTKEYDEKMAKTIKTADEIINKSADLQIVPIYSYLLIKPYLENPYNKVIISDNGLVLDAGLAPTFQSKETGETGTEENLIKVGQVLEVGPDVKYVKEGDDVYYKKFSEVPIPFFKQGFAVVHENNILVVINENIKERLNGR